MDAIFLLSLVQFCGMFQMSHGQLFGLMLNNPLALTSLDPHSKLNHRGLTHEDREMNEQPDSAHRGAIRSGVDTVLIRCKQDSDCIDDDDNISGHPENLMYCDRHYGFCDFFRQVGELCRHDSQCDSGLICMFGKCAQPFAAGERGSRCLNGNDCASGLCCARQHGERICKPKLKLGQHCFVPSGGLDYSLNELCPCDEGLECQQVKAKAKRKRHFKIDNVMRCTLNKSSLS